MSSNTRSSGPSGKVCHRRKAGPRFRAKRPCFSEQLLLSCGSGLRRADVLVALLGLTLLLGLPMLQVSSETLGCHTSFAQHS